jgi:hypothetical protein
MQTRRKRENAGYCAGGEGVGGKSFLTTILPNFYIIDSSPIRYIPYHFFSEACMKKLLFLAVAAMTLGLGVASSVQAAGGVVPCIATCFFGDPRIGLYMNDGKSVETDDWISLVLNYVGGWGQIYNGFKAYEASKEGSSFCVGYLWGRRAGSEFKTTKLRTKEILMCIPVLDIYPCIAIPCEAYNGKTMSQVIKEEGLAR